MSRILYPEINNGGGVLSYTATVGTNSVVVGNNQTISFNEALIRTSSFTTPELTLSTAGSFAASTTLHLRYSLNGIAQGSVTPTQNTFYLVDGNNASYAVKNAISAAVLNAPSAIDFTYAANNNTANDIIFFNTGTPLTNDTFSIGYTTTFSSITFNVGTAGIGTYTVTWQYWNGTTWTALSGVVDNTTAFKTGGSNTLTFTLPSDWAVLSGSLNGSNLYYIRAVLSMGTMTTHPLGTQITIGGAPALSAAFQHAPPPVDYTTAANNGTANDINLFRAAPAVNDAFYVGYSGTFSSIFFNIGTAGSGTWTLTWEYWNGTVWNALTVIDSTGSLKISGTNAVTFAIPNDWQTLFVNSQGPFYYVRARISAFTSVSVVPLGTQIWITTPATSIDDALLAYIQTDGSKNILSSLSVPNQSKLVVNTLTVSGATKNNSIGTTSTTNLIFTLDSGELGAGVSGGTGASGLQIHRGSLTDYQFLFTELPIKVLQAGIIGSLLTIPRMKTNPASNSGKIFFANPTVGDEIDISSNLFWDNTNFRLGVGTTSPGQSIHTTGSIRAGGSFFILNSSSASQTWNADENGNYISSNPAARIIGTSPGIKISVAVSGVSGNAITWIDSILIGNSGTVGILTAASTDAIKIAGTTRIESTTPYLYMKDTSGAVGAQLLIEGVVTSTNPLFKIIDNQGGPTTVLTILKNYITTLSSYNLILTSSTALNDSSIDIINSSTTKKARIRLDAFDGTFVKNLEIYQDPTSLNGIITTKSSGGNIILASKWDGVSTFTGLIGINKTNPANTLDVSGNMRLTGTNAYQIYYNDTSGKGWYNWQDTSGNFIIGETDQTSGNYAFRIFTGKNIDFGSSGFFYARSTNRVGLGTNSPTNQLHVISAAGAGPVYQILIDGAATTGSNAVGAAIEINSSATNNNYISHAAATVLQFSSGYNYGSGTDFYEIKNETAFGTALKIAKTTNDIQFVGASINFYWKRSSSLLILNNASSSAEPTFNGYMQIQGSSGVGIVGGIEYKTDVTGSGSGVRFFSIYNASPLYVDYVYSGRLNSANWTSLITTRYNGNIGIFIFGVPTSTTSDATNPGALRFDGANTLAGGGGIEYKVNATGNGSAIRTYGTTASEYATTSYGWNISARKSSLTWSQVFSVKSLAAATGGGTTIVSILSVPLFANDAAAATGGLITGDLWQDSSGNLHIKL